MIIFVACMLHNFTYICNGGKHQLWLNIEREKDAKIDREIEETRLESIVHEQQQFIFRSLSISKQRRLGNFLIAPIPYVLVVL